MRIIFIVFLLISTIYANDLILASSIFNKVVSSVTQKDDAQVYLHTDIESLSKFPGKLQIVKECEKADIVIWDMADYRELPYHYGVNLVKTVIKRGKVVVEQ